MSKAWRSPKNTMMEFFRFLLVLFTGLLKHVVGFSVYRITVEHQQMDMEFQDEMATGLL